MNNEPNHSPSYNPTSGDKEKRDAQRRGETFRYRIMYGGKELLRRPWKITLVVMLCAAFLLCWLNRYTIISHIPMNFSILPNLVLQVFTYALYALIITLFVLLLALLLYAMGTPPDVRKVDRAVAETFRNDVSYGNWPIYLSRQYLSNVELFRWEFFSRFVPLETWEAREKKVGQMLHGYIDGFENGGKDGNDPHYVVVYVGQGVNPREVPATPDPCFKKEGEL